MSPSVVECSLSMYMVLGEGVRRERGRRDEFATSASNWNYWHLCLQLAADGSDSCPRGPSSGLSLGSNPMPIRVADRYLGYSIHWSCGSLLLALIGPHT